MGFLGYRPSRAVPSECDGRRRPRAISQMGQMPSGRQPLGLIASGPLEGAEEEIEELALGGHPELAINLLQVVAHCAGGDVERARDAFDRVAPEQELDDLAFTL